MGQLLTRYMKMVPTKEAEGQHIVPNGINITIPDFTRYLLVVINYSYPVRGAQAKHEN